VEASSAGDSGPRRPLAGAVRRGSSATLGQARKRAAHRRTPVARRVAGWRRQSGFPVTERRAPPPVRHSYAVLDRSVIGPSREVRTFRRAAVRSYVVDPVTTVTAEAPAARPYVVDPVTTVTAEAPAARPYVVDPVTTVTAEAPAARSAYARCAPQSLTPFAPAVLASPTPTSRLPLRVPPRTARRPHLTPPQPRRSPPRCSGDRLPRTRSRRRLRRRLSERPSVSHYSRPPGARRRAPPPVRKLVSRLSARCRTCRSPSRGRSRSPRPTPPARRPRLARRP